MNISRETLAAFGRELASFRLQLPAANSNARCVAIKEASTALADLGRYFADARRHKAIADLARDLSCFSLAPVATPLFEIKRSPNGTEISGYASVFGNVDQDGEIVDRGAFTASLAQHRKDGTRPLLLWQHKSAEPIGIWDHFEEDSIGLLATGRLLPTVQRGAEAIALIGEGAIYGLSIGFRTVRDRVINKIRHLENIDLLEVSLVSFASNSDARIHLTGKEYGHGSKAKVLVDLNRELADFSLARFG
jgi:HK97 family phage prohead protease